MQTSRNLACSDTRAVSINYFWSHCQSIYHSKSLFTAQEELREWGDVTMYKSKFWHQSRMYFIGLIENSYTRTLDKRHWRVLTVLAQVETQALTTYTSVAWMTFLSTNAASRLVSRLDGLLFLKEDSNSAPDFSAFANTATGLQKFHTRPLSVLVHCHLVLLLIHRPKRCR